MQYIGIRLGIILEDALYLKTASLFTAALFACFTSTTVQILTQLGGGALYLKTASRRVTRDACVCVCVCARALLVLDRTSTRARGDAAADVLIRSPSRLPLAASADS
jgi:hypothetical protein